ncbi:MAG: retroviral-like aspartic protease family protein [Candidatus Zixiibacteriota bacterium]
MKRYSFIYTKLIGMCVCFVSGIFAASPGDILKFHLDALGGRENVARVYSIKGYASADYMGSPAKLEVYMKFPNQSFVKYDMGQASIMVLTDGLQGWTTDINGMTKANSPEELKSFYNDAYINTYSYLLPDRNPGRTEYRGDTLINDANFHQFALFPEAGDSTSIFINSVSGLIDYRLEILSGLKIQTSYSDNREVDGVVMPFESVSEAIGTSFLISSRLDSVFLNVDISDTIFSNPSGNDDIYSFGNGRNYMDVAFAIKRGHITLKALVNGQGPFDFILDSGAGSSLLSQGTVQALGLEPFGALPARGVGGLNNITIVEIDSINIENLTLKYNRIGVYNSEPKTGNLFAGIDGILGYDFISRFPLKIDFDRDILTAYHKDLAPRNPRGIPINLDIQFQLPLINVEVDGMMTRTAIDLGAQVEFVMRSNAKAYSLIINKFDSSSQNLRITGVGGVERVKTARLDSIKIGRLIIENPKTLLFDTGNAFPLPDYIEGLIGLELLDDFNLFIDYNLRTIYFEARHGLKN